MAMKWLEGRWPGLLEDMAEYDRVEREADAKIQAICEAEMATWRTYCQTYCQTRETLTFLEMIFHTRVCLRFNLPAPQNEWCNPETGEWEHVGLKSVNCTEDEWAQLRKQYLDQRLLLSDPEALISRAKGLLYKGLMEADAWPELVVGITLLTGRTFLQILKHGRFALNTPLSLLFRDQFHFNPFLRDPFEIPTLGRADLIVEAWERVRALIDCSEKSEQEILQAYGKMVNETAFACFRDLVPLHPGEKSLFPVLSRAVYPCLATRYYCPASVDEVEYVAAVTGDFLVLWLASPGERFVYSVLMNQAFTYGVADEQGKIDERKSLWLDREGVKIVETLRRPYDVGRHADHEDVEVVFDGNDLRAFDDLRSQMGYGLAPGERGAEENEDERERRTEADDDNKETAAYGSMKLLIHFRNHGVSPSLYAFIQAGVKHLRDDVAEFVQVSLQQELLDGLKLQRPFSVMLTSELMACRHPQAVYELTRRTIVQVMRYNRWVSDPRLRWYVNEELIVSVLQTKDLDALRQCLQDYQQEIEEHHYQFELTVAWNTKSVAVTKVITLAEHPALFHDDEIC